MKDRQPFWAILAITVLILTAFFACKKKPTAPVRENPFDPKNVQTQGDPFKLTAKIANGGILLEWTRPQMNNLKSFNIYRSEQETSGYSKIKDFSASTNQFTDTDVQNGHSYWYVVTAVNAKGEESTRTNIAPVNIKTTPVLVINGGAKYTTTRQVTLTILANSATQMMLSNNADFPGTQWENYTTSKTWTLEIGDGEKTVYMKVRYDNGKESDIINKRIILDTTPPIAQLIVTPDSGITNETVFQFNPTNSCDNIFPIDDLKVRYDYENDGTYDTEWEELKITNHKYQIGGGNKTVKMELKDGIDWETEITENLFINTPPQAEFIVNRDENNYRLYHFDASASHDYEDDHNIQYRWDFDGDGTWDTKWLTQDTVSYGYAQDSSYNIILNVRDQYKLTSEKRKKIVVKSVFVEMIYVAGGTFDMGCTREQNDCESDEKPVHNVTINSFYIGKFEITNKQIVKLFNWALEKNKIKVSNTTVKNVQGDQQELLDLDDPDCQISYNGIELYVEKNYDNYPVVEISWYGAVAFCNYFSEKEGLIRVYDMSDWSANWDANGYRLPTEAEWEYAARGGSEGSSTMYAGSNIIDDVAWYKSNSYSHTHEVGTKYPNELGIYDMSGNVWEWCWDWYSNIYYSYISKNNPKGPDNGLYRVDRGGSWYNYSKYLRVSNRDYYEPFNGSHGLGFRILRNP